jgi:hypothetical protein
MFIPDWPTVVGVIGAGLAATVAGQVAAERLGLTRRPAPPTGSASRRQLVDAVVEWAAAGEHARPTDLMNICVPPRRGSTLAVAIAPVLLLASVLLALLALTRQADAPWWALTPAMLGMFFGVMGLAMRPVPGMQELAGEDSAFRVAVVQEALESVWRRETPDALRLRLDRLLNPPARPERSAAAEPPAPVPLKPPARFNRAA